MHLNQLAREIVEPLLQRPARYAAACHRIGGAWVVDCGVHATGSDEAGLVMAHAALAGPGHGALHPPCSGTAAWAGCPWPTVAVTSPAPVAACLASQYAGWRVKAPGYFAMASGPIRAAIGREDLFDTIGCRERPDAVVGLLEAAALPPEDVCRKLAADAGVPPDAVVLLVARTASRAGTLQVIARSLETALHKLHDLGCDLRPIRAGSGTAPLAPVPDDDLVAIGRTNDAILYGGHVTLEIAGDSADLVACGPRMVSGASAAAGEPFLKLFEKAGGDFYALDPALFAPARVDLVAVETDRRSGFGRLEPEIVAASFGSPVAGGAET